MQTFFLNFRLIVLCGHPKSSSFLPWTHQICVKRWARQYVVCSLEITRKKIFRILALNLNSWLSVSNKNIYDIAFLHTSYNWNCYCGHAGLTSCLFSRMAFFEAALYQSYQIKTFCQLHLGALNVCKQNTKIFKYFAQKDKDFYFLVLIH